MKNSKNTVAFLIALIGAAILAFSYVYGVAYFKNKTEAVAATNRSLKNQADAYEMLYIQSADFVKQSAEMKSEFPSLYKPFVYDITTEDKILYIKNMEDANVKEQLVINYLNMGTPGYIPYSPAIESNPAFAAGAIAAPNVSKDSVELATYPIDYGFNVTYQGFKDMVKYLNNKGTAKQISAVSLSFDNSTGILNGIISVDNLVLYGTDCVYNEIPIPYVPLTVENIFGTIEIPEEEGDTASPKQD